MHKLSVFWISVFLPLMGMTQTALKPPSSIFGVYGQRVSVCFNASPESKNQFDCEGETANWVLVVPTANFGVWVEVNLLFHNGHICTFQENGQWMGNHVLLTRFDAQACELRLRFKNGKVILSDDGRCREQTCGARGSYDGVSLPKRGSL
jgi:hypothetical protein